MVIRDKSAVVKVYKRMARLSHYISVSRYQSILEPWPITDRSLVQIPEEKTYHGTKKQVGYFLDQKV